jgi:hypothetical protein
VQEPGLDKHGWETEWEALEPLVEDSPAEALPELDNLVERMLVEQGHVTEGDVEAELEAEAERDLVAELLMARQVTRLVEQGETVDPGDIAAGVNAYRSLYEELLSAYLA